MPTTEVDIWNRAVGNCGHSSNRLIEDTGEDTPNARRVRLYWDETRRAFLEENWWSFATAFEDLGEHISGATAFWQYAYIRPANCFAPRRILGTTPDEYVPFEEGVVNGNDPVIWCTRRDATLEFTADVTDYNVWPGAVITALALKLAIDMSPEFTGALTNIGVLFTRYEDALERASVGSHNRQRRFQEENESLEFNEARHGTGSLNQNYSQRREGFIDDG